MHCNGAQIIIHLLERHGITTVAGIPGGANLPLYDALHRSPIRHILARHEQGAGFIAQGMARTNGKPSVCFATSGPGATNIITALADAKLDSVPVIVVTGQVALPLIGTDAFQEVDTVGMTLSITKHNFLVRSARELCAVIPASFRIAASGRPGPVLVDVPKDVQQQQCVVDQWPENGIRQSSPPIDPKPVERIAELIARAKRPLLCIGGGVIQAGASEALRRLSQKNTLPVISTLMGLGAMPYDDPLFLGMLGMHGAPYANRIVDTCDLLLAFGTRFGDRATGNVAHFAPQATVVHIDIDQSEFDKIKRVDETVTGDITEAIEMLDSMVPRDLRIGWRDFISSMRAKHPFSPPPSGDRYHPGNIIRTIGALADPEAVVATDVGQHQMWVARYYPFDRPRTFLTSGGLGTMGFGLPAAIGAGLARPEGQVLCFTGDGSLLMNLQELATLAELDLNVKILLMNNGQLGLVRQQQELFYQGRLIASRFLRNPDFPAIAGGFGIRGFDLSGQENPAAALSAALRAKGPTLINIPLQPELQVLPMVPPGAPNHQMIGA